jgi:hypothetical protein
MIRRSRRLSQRGETQYPQITQIIAERENQDPQITQIIAEGGETHDP